MVLIAVLCALSFVLIANVVRWKPPHWLFVFGIIWAVFLFYPSAHGLLIGQIGTVLACLQIIAIWALATNRERLAGVLIALSTGKPQLAILLLPFLLLWGIRFKRWQFVLSTLATLAILAVISFLVLPSWFSDWLAQINTYRGYHLTVTSVWVLTNRLIPLGGAVELAISLLLVLLLLWSWYRVIWLYDLSMFHWTVALTLTSTHLIIAPTATAHFVVFLFVLVFYFRQLSEWNHNWGPLLVFATMFIIAGALWGLFAATLSAKFESLLNYLPLPFLSIILLLVTQRLWQQESRARVKISEQVQGN